MAVVWFVVTSLELFVINRLLKASRRDSNISAETALFWTRFWCNLNICFLVIGILMELITFEPKSILTLVVGVPIRVYMILTVGKYVDALKERVRETVPNSEFCGVSTTQESSELGDDLV